MRRKCMEPVGNCRTNNKDKEGLDTTETATKSPKGGIQGSIRRALLVCNKINLKRGK